MIVYLNLKSSDFQSSFDIFCFANFVLKIELLLPEKLATKMLSNAFLTISLSAISLMFLGLGGTVFGLSEFDISILYFELSNSIEMVES